MRWFLVFPVALVLGCVLDGISPKALAAPANSSGCQSPPAAATSKFRHTRSRILAKLGSPRHRGVDLIAVEGDENQTVSGKLAYTKSDKDLQDEDVQIFACVAKQWRAVGTTRSDSDGRFELTLAGPKRLPVGMHDLYAHVPGDGSGVAFLGFVAKQGESVIVSDIDGTITASENAVYQSVFRGKDIAHQPGAPEAFAASGKTIIYVTARGDQLTAITREWLAAHGFPRGPVRLAKSMVTLPGQRTIALKTTTLADLRVPIAAGVGNRASDVAAYRNAGLPADRIFINLPEFTRELRATLAAGEATAFDDYNDLKPALRR